MLVPVPKKQGHNNFPHYDQLLSGRGCRGGRDKCGVSVEGEELLVEAK